MARFCPSSTCDKSAPITVRLSSVYKMKGSFIIGKAKMGVVVSRDFRVSKVPWTLGVHLKFAVTSLALCSGGVFSAKF